MSQPTAVAADEEDVCRRSSSSTAPAEKTRAPVCMELPRFLPLTTLYVGRFPSTNHSVLFLWVSGLGSGRSDPEKSGCDKPKKMLVFVLVQDEKKDQPAKWLRKSRFAMASCPYFAPPTQGKPFSGVCTFEIPLSEIVGVDYQNPLFVGQNRMVVEVKKITRRWFCSLERCSSHYQWGCADRSQTSRDTACTDGTGGSGECSDSVRLISDLYQPFAGDEILPPSLPQVVVRQQFMEVPDSPSKRGQAYWIDKAEEKSFTRLNGPLLKLEKLTDFAWKRSDSLQSPPNFDGYRSVDQEFIRKRSQSASDSDLHEDALNDADPKEEVDVEEIIYNKTVQFKFEDPFVHYVLREVVHDPEHAHLLRLYEAGLPSWAIFSPMYTGLYRRWMRILMAAMIMVISCVSMVLGFYDVYTRIPAVREFMASALGPISRLMEVGSGYFSLSVVFNWATPYSSVLRRLWHAAKATGTVMQRLARGVMWPIAVLLSWMWAELGPWISAMSVPVRTLANVGHGAIRGLLDCFSYLTRGCRSTLSGISAMTRVFRSFFGGISNAGGGAQMAMDAKNVILRAEFATVRRAIIGIYNSVMVLVSKFVRHQVSIWQQMHKLRDNFRRLRYRIWRGLWLRMCQRPLFSIVFLVMVTFSWVYPLIFFEHYQELLEPIKRPLAWCKRNGLSDQTVVVSEEWRYPWLGQLASLACAHLDTGPADGVTEVLEKSVVERISSAALQTVGRFLSGSDAAAFQVLEIGLICSHVPALGAEVGGSLCWQQQEGGRRCHCPLRNLNGINVTYLSNSDQTDLSATPVALEIPPHRFPNGSFTEKRAECMSTHRGSRNTGGRLTRSCIVRPTALNYFFRGSSAEFVAIDGSPRASRGNALWRSWNLLRTSVQALHSDADTDPGANALAAFVLEAPRGPGADPPGDVQLCTLVGMGHSGSTSSTTASFTDEDSSTRILPQCLPPHPDLERSLPAEDGIPLMVSWDYARRRMGSCSFVKWQAYIRHGSRRQLLCESNRQSASSCMGRFAGVTDAGQPTSLFASVALRCVDGADANEPISEAWARFVSAGSVAASVPAISVEPLQRPLFSLPSAASLAEICLQVAASGQSYAGGAQRKHVASGRPTANVANAWSHWHSLCCGLLLARLVGRMWKGQTDKVSAQLAQE